MDAAQMLSAQEIARQCERLARTQQREHSAELEAAYRHLRLVEPVTEPIPRLTNSASDIRWPGSSGASRRDLHQLGNQASGGVGSEGGGLLSTERPGPAGSGLSEQEQGILAFERQWWKRPGAKDRAIRELFDMSAARYYQVLNALVDDPAALRADPMLIKRLRRARASRQRGRAARRPGIEWY